VREDSAPSVVHKGLEALMATTQTMHVVGESDNGKEAIQNSISLEADGILSLRTP
jgi:DNA-binding NarL/FixJ family response regulator